jgi:hypothetical protein
MSSIISIDPQSSVALAQSASYLCSKCQYLFDYWTEATQQNLNGNQGDFCDNNGIFELEASARIGCILCKRSLNLAKAMDLEMVIPRSTMLSKSAKL